MNHQPPSSSHPFEQISTIRGITTTKQEPLIENLIGKRQLFDSENMTRFHNIFRMESDFIDENQSNHIEKCPYQQPQQDKQLQQTIQRFKGKYETKYVVSKKATLKRTKFGYQNGFNDVWKQGALRIIYLITKFLQVLKNQTHQYKFKLMTRKNFSVLNDRATDYNFYFFNNLFREKPTKLNRIAYFLQYASQKKYSIPIKLNVIQPDGRFKLFWDILLLLIIITNIFYIPMKLSFDFTNFQMGYILDDIPSYFLLLDTLLKFNTAFYKDGKKYVKRKKIFKHYLKGDFLYDSAITLPFFLSQWQVPYMDFLLLLRISKVSFMVETFEDNTSVRDKFGAILDLGKLICINIFISHICACAWHYIGLIQQQNYPSEKMWLSRYGLNEAAISTRYIYSFYWSTITVATVGYGDITPQTEMEMLFVIMMVLITSIVFGHTISSIGSIFAQIKQKNDKLKTISRYIKQNISDQQLQIKTRKYFENYFKNQQVRKEECEQFLDILSDDLKQEVKIDIYKQMLMGCKIISENFSEQFLEQLCQKVKKSKYSPGEIIFRAGELNDKLLIILEGEIKIFSDDSNQKQTKKIQYLRSYKSGFVIGSKSFLIGSKREFCAKTSKFSELAFIEWADFYKSLKDNPQDFEKYSLIKENLIFNPWYKKVIDVCAICQQNHNFLKCPFTFFIPNKNKLISDKTQVTKINKRKSFKRKSLRDYFEGKKEDIQEKAILLIVDAGLLKESDIDENFLQKTGVIPTKGEDDRFLYEIQQSSSSFQHQNSKFGKISEGVSQASPHQHEAEGESQFNLKAKNENYEKKKTSTKESKKKLFELFKPRFLKSRSTDSNDSDYEDQMEIIESEFRLFLIEDKIPHLDKATNYEFFYCAYNLDVILHRLEQIQKDKGIFLTRDKQKIKTTRSAKIQPTKIQQRPPRSSQIL